MEFIALLGVLLPIFFAYWVFSNIFLRWDRYLDTKDGGRTYEYESPLKNFLDKDKDLYKSIFGRKEKKP